MGELLQTRVHHLDSLRNQPHRSTQPGHPFVGRRNEYQRKLGRMNRHIARCTNSTSVISQCKLVSGSGLRKQRPAPLYGPCCSGRILRFRLYLLTRCLQSEGAAVEFVRLRRSLQLSTRQQNESSPQMCRMVTDD